MKAIWKYPFEVKDEFTLSIPVLSEVLKVEVQNHVACLWALVTTDANEEDVRFRVVGTGHKHPDGWWVGWKHVDSFQDSVFVWHVFMEVGR